MPQGEVLAVVVDIDKPPQPLILYSGISEKTPGRDTACFLLAASTQHSIRSKGNHGMGANEIEKLIFTFVIYRHYH